MKKILILVIVLYFLTTSPAYAYPSCLSTQVNLSAYPPKDPVCNPIGTPNNKKFTGLSDCTTGQDPCGPNSNRTFCTDTSRNVVGCWPKGTTTVDPTCRPNYKSVPIHNNACHDQWGQCCKIVAVNMCRGEAQPLITDCNLWANAGELSPRDYCSDLTYRYNQDTKKCEKFAKSVWKLNSTCDNNTDGVQTAIGCVPTGNLTVFLTFVLKFAFFASGGIVLLMVIATGYTLMTSQGNPEKLQAAKENIVAIFSGLILIAFSLILLQVIGADVLKLPTFIP